MNGKTLQNRLVIATGMWRDATDEPLPKLAPGEPAAQIEEFELRLVDMLCRDATPAPAAAAPTQESMFQDDYLLVFKSPSSVAKTMDTLRYLGVDRIRVTVFWNLIAPSAASRNKPRFDATDPAAYSPGAWQTYDTIVRLAAARGIGVNFNVLGAVPARAGGRSTYAPLAGHFYPS